SYFRHSDFSPKVIIAHLPEGKPETEYRVGLQVNVDDEYGTTIVTPQLYAKAMYC
ncbi:hypothetical protein ACJMK2_005064, partial [Sinanodonta woodiana]